MNTRALLAALALLVSIAGVVFAQESGTWDPAANVSNKPGLSHQSTLAFDPRSNNTWVVWREAETGSLGEIVARRWNSKTCAWSPHLTLPPEDLSASTWFDSGPAIVFDGAGTGLVFWTRRTCVVDGASKDVSGVMWRAWDGNRWTEARYLFQTETCLPSSYGSRLIPVVTQDAIRLYIIWGNGYRVAEYQDGAWSPVSGPIYLAFPGDLLPELADVVIGPDGVVHAAAYAENSGNIGYDPWFYDAYYLRYDGSTWSTPVNLSATDGVADDVALGFDPAGRLHFLWSDPDSIYSSESQKSTIWERILEEGAWSPNQEILTYNPGQGIDGFSFTTGVTGTLHIAWSEGVFDGALHTDLDLRYQEGDGTTWEPEEIVYTSTLPTRYPALILHAASPAIAWEEGTLDDRDVYFASQCNGGSSMYEVYLPLIRTLRH